MRFWGVRSHCYSSLPLCQLFSVVFSSMPEKDSLIGSAQPVGGSFLGQSPALDESAVARGAARSHPQG